jgi:hypothetical protein
LPRGRRFWHLPAVHADRYFGRYRVKDGHAACTREPTLLTITDMAPRNAGCWRPLPKRLLDQLGYRFEPWVADEAAL